MSENSNQEEITKKDKSKLIGALLILPIYFVLLGFIKRFKLNYYIPEELAMIIFGLILYLPIFIGMIISFKSFKDYSIAKVFMILFLLLSIFNYYHTYFVDKEGWNGLGFFVYWLIGTVLYRISAILYYESFVGWKKTLKLLAICVLLLGFSFFIGFWG